ncbi:MAG: 2-oxoglutarate and iron-dependent oxygenase domain-containing protein [Chakrabartia sp.]
MKNNVPTLSLLNFEKDAAGFAADLGLSFETYGFAVIADHGIDAALIDQAWALTKAFFALPVDIKNQYYTKELAGQRGYTPFGTEIAKDADKHDLKEFWHVGRDLPAGHRYRDHMPDNIWPEEIDGFQERLTTLFAAFDTAGGKLLSAIALHLGLYSDWFDGPVENGNSILRLLHYPPIPVDADGIRAGAHEDINLITLLLGAEEAGLQLLGKDGEWLAIDPPHGAMVVNVGDMLERLTNNVMPSTTHRVINPPPERRHLPRYSMPFFLHLASDFLIETLPNCITEGHPDLYPEPITANDFLTERLIEIGLLKR